MSDPRNVAHDKKVKQEKQREKPEPSADGPTKKSSGKKTAGPADQKHAIESTITPAEIAKAEQGPTDMEKSVAILSKLKEMEFHSRANIETLAKLTLTIEDELKQKEFSEPLSVLYPPPQDGFHTEIAALIERYEAKCQSLKQPA